MKKSNKNLLPARAAKAMLADEKNKRAEKEKAEKEKYQKNREKIWKEKVIPKINTSIFALKSNAKIDNLNSVESDVLQYLAVELGYRVSLSGVVGSLESFNHYFVINWD